MTESNLSDLFQKFLDIRVAVDIFEDALLKELHQVEEELRNGIVENARIQVLAMIRAIEVEAGKEDA